MTTTIGTAHFGGTPEQTTEALLAQLTEKLAGQKSALTVVFARPITETSAKDNHVATLNGQPAWEVWKEDPRPPQAQRPRAEHARCPRP